MELNDIINQINLIRIYRKFHLNTEECTFFSETLETFSKIRNIFGCKDTNMVNIKDYSKVEIILFILYNHDGLELDITTKEATETKKS